MGYWSDVDIMANDSRRKVVEVGDGFLALFLGAGRKHYEPTKDVIPDDARIVGVRHDPFNHRVEFLVESDEFDPVPEGQPYPRLDPIMRSIYEPERRLDSVN